MSIQKCLLDNSSRMIKAMSTAKSNSNEVKTEFYQEASIEDVDTSDTQTSKDTEHVVPAKRRKVKEESKSYADEFQTNLEKQEKNCKELCETFGALLAQKLFNLGEEDRLILMNQIDNLVFETALQARKKTFA